MLKLFRIGKGVFPVPTFRSKGTPLCYVRPRVIYRHSHIGGNLVRPEYAISSRAFGIAYIDRTETLDPGFPYRVLEPLPDFGRGFSLLRVGGYPGM